MAVLKDGAPGAAIADGDSIIFFDFRSDRARELTCTFSCDEFDSFERGPRKQVTDVGFTDDDVTIFNQEITFPKLLMRNTLGEWLPADAAPTLPEMTDMEKPEKMTGESLLIRKSEKEV